MTLWLPLLDEVAALSERRSYSVQYEGRKGGVIRHVVVNGKRYTSRIKAHPQSEGLPADWAERFDWFWLRAKDWPEIITPRGELAVADLFCGSGGLSLGAWEAARALQLRARSVFAIDNDADAVSVYDENFHPSYASCATIESLVDGELGRKATQQEKGLSRKLGKIDLLLAGPPCQGHSDLNNHTRRSDPRNELILRVVRFAELFAPRHIIIENVQGVRHDKSGAFQRAELGLRKLGYSSEAFLLEGKEIGIAQKRRRCFLLASRTASLSVARIKRMHSCPERSFDWACSDLNAASTNSVFDSSAKVYPDNQRRMNYLIKHDLYDLPDSERPDCHRLKEHDYRSVYGRIRADIPTPTITTGFGSPGQGRFTHPREARTITPHEAARLQFLPDFFHFGISKRKRIQKLVGNSVPPKMAYVSVLDLLCNE